jgi:hypothetical protein
VVLTANAAHAMQRLMAIHAETARELGYEPLIDTERPTFTLEDLPLIQSVFTDARRHVSDVALVFLAAGPALRFSQRAASTTSMPLPPTAATGPFCWSASAR